MNCYFEELEGRVGLKRVWEFVIKVRKKRNIRMKVSCDSFFFCSLKRSGLLADIECPAGIWGRHITDRAWGEARPERRW